MSVRVQNLVVWLSLNHTKMTVNPYGCVMLEDFGAPKVITGKAREVISGGQFVVASGATGVISSGADSFVTSDLECTVTSVSGTTFTGVALKNTASGAYVPIALEGVFIVSAGGTCVAGMTVVAMGSDSIEGAVTAGATIGRALTSATSGAYCVVYIK